eukprot:225033-Rhodomonas_salina.6
MRRTDACAAHAVLQDDRRVHQHPQLPPGAADRGVGEPAVQELHAPVRGPDRVRAERDLPDDARHAREPAHRVAPEAPHGIPGTGLAGSYEKPGTDLRGMTLQYAAQQVIPIRVIGVNDSPVSPLSAYTYHNPNSAMISTEHSYARVPSPPKLVLTWHLLRLVPAEQALMYDLVRTYSPHATIVYTAAIQTFTR